MTKNTTDMQRVDKTLPALPDSSLSTTFILLLEQSQPESPCWCVADPELAQATHASPHKDACVSYKMGTASPKCMIDAKTNVGIAALI